MMTAIGMIDPEDDDDSMLPDVGFEVAPTSEQIVQGHVGNGTRDQFTPELASRIQVERAEMKREIAASRREAYEEGMKDALKESASLTTGLVGIGNEILERLEQGEDLDRLMLDTLKLANTASAQVPDRAIGKAKAITEIKTETKILNMFHGRVEISDDSK